MSEAQLSEILARLVVNSEKQEERFVAAQNQIAEQQKQITELLSTIKDPPPVNVEFNQPGPAANVVRAEKVQKITFNVSKSKRLKPYKVSQDIKLFFEDI